VIPFGVVIGTKVSESTVNDAAGWAGSFLMYAGSAHLAVVSGLGAGAGVVAILAAVVINARLVLYSAALTPSFREQPRWFRLVGPYFLTDQLYAFTTQRVESGDAAGSLRWSWGGKTSCGPLVLAGESTEHRSPSNVRRPVGTSADGAAGG
jgi:predicted branched-subunit amino acid permease